jgi:hypothetical protein
LVEIASSVNSVSSVSSSNFPRKKVGRARGVKNIKILKMKKWEERG